MINTNQMVTEKNFTPGSTIFYLTFLYMDLANPGKMPVLFSFLEMLLAFYQLIAPLLIAGCSENHG